MNEETTGRNGPQVLFPGVSYLGVKSLCNFCPCRRRLDSTFAKFFAKDWICLGPSRVLSKSEFVENVRRNFITHERDGNPYTIEKKNMQVHVFGDTAVVTYVKEYRQTPDTTKFFDEDDTDVFTREAGGWRLRFTKVVPVPTQAAAN